MNSLERCIVSYETMMDAINIHQFWIYGYGGIARRFYQCIKRMDAMKNLRGFIVSNAKNVNTKRDFFDEYPIVSVDDGKRDEMVLIAVDIFNVREIYSALIRLKYKKILWIYFNLYDLEFGLPIQTDVLLNVDRLFKNSYWSDWMVACYLVIEDVFFDTNINRELYIKFASIWLGHDSAVKDWKRFVEKMQKYIGQGYTKDYNIKVSRDKDIVIDGAHRIAIAKYFGVKTINADVYDCTKENFVKFRLGSKPWDFNVKPWRNFLSASELKRIDDVFDRT